MFEENANLHKKLAQDNQYFNQIYHDPYILLKTYNMTEKVASN
jgi:hypothetical protein